MRYKASYDVASVQLTAEQTGGGPFEQVDLDLPPRQRWEHVMTATRAGTGAVVQYLFGMLPAEVHAAVDRLVADEKGRLPKWASQEMRAGPDFYPYLSHCSVAFECHSHLPDPSRSSLAAATPVQAFTHPASPA